MQAMTLASQALVASMGSGQFNTMVQTLSLPGNLFAPALYNATSTASNIAPPGPPVVIVPAAANPSPTPSAAASGLSLGGKIAIGIVFGSLGLGLIVFGVFYYYKQSQPLPAEMTVFKVGGDKGNANRGATFEMSSVESNPVVAHSTSRI